MVVAQRLLHLGMLGDPPQRCAEEVHRGLLAGAEQVGGDHDDLVDFWQRAIGERCRRECGEHVVARLAAAVLDVAREPVVHEGEWIRDQLVDAAPHRRVRLLLLADHLVAERGAVRFGDAEEIGNDDRGERLRELADEFALVLAEDLVELHVGPAPHEVLVVLEALRGDEAQEQAAMGRVLRRVHRRELFAEHQLVAVLLDEVTHVVAVERHRELPPGDGVARGPRRVVVVHRDRFVVPAHERHVVVRLPPHGALRASEFPVLVGGGGRRRVEEVVDLLEVGHRCSP